MQRDTTQQEEMMSYRHVQQHGQISDASVKEASLQAGHTAWVHLWARLSGRKTDPLLPGAGLGGGVVCRAAPGTLQSDARDLCVPAVMAAPWPLLLELAEVHTNSGELQCVCQFYIGEIGGNNRDSADENKSGTSLASLLIIG